MTPIFKGQPELMAAIPHLNGPTTQLATTLTQPFPIFPRGREFIRHKHIQAFLLPSPSLFLLLLFPFFLSSLLPSMASSLKRTRRGSGGTFSGEGGSSVARGAAARAAEDSGDSSGLGSRSPETLGDILGQPTIDPWYRNGERFPSVPASL